MGQSRWRMRSMRRRRLARALPVGLHEGSPSDTPTGGYYPQNRDPAIRNPV